MFRRVRAAARLGLCLLLPLMAGAAVLVPEFRLRERAAQDITTPISLTVIDPHRTEELRQKEAQRVAPFLRVDPRVADDAEAALQSAFTNTHAAFRAGLVKQFGSAELNVADLDAAAFREFAAGFRRTRVEFPLGNELARLWALGSAGLIAQTQWVAQLRAAQVQPVLRSNLPPAARSSLGSVRVVSVHPLDAPLDPSRVDKLGRSTSRTNVLVLSRARREAQKTFPLADAPTAKFLAGFLRENSLFDPVLTAAARALRTNSLFAADHYEAGQRLVQRGREIDARALLALAELRVRTAATEARAQAAAEQLKAQAAVAQWQSQAAQARQQAVTVTTTNRWLVLACVMSLIGLLALLAVLWGRRRRGMVLVPAGRGSVEVLPADEGVWPALSHKAPRPSDPLQAVVRAGLLPHLAQWLTRQLSGRLAAERASVAEAQQQAEAEVAQIESRLAALQAPLAERLVAYEQRIAELEKQLSQMGEENRELLEAKLELARKKLEAERGRQPSWN